MNKKLFSSAVGICLAAAAIGNAAPFTALAHPTERTTEPTHSKTDEAASLTDTAWRLMQIRYSDRRQFRLRSPGNYTVEFTKDGQLTVNVDGSQVLGSFTEEGNKLDIEVGSTTLATYPSESFQREYLQALQDADVYHLQSDNRFIEIRFGSGTMRFSALSDRLHRNQRPHWLQSHSE